MVFSSKWPVCSSCTRNDKSARDRKSDEAVERTKKSSDRKFSMAANSSSSSPSSRECRLSRLSAESMMEEGGHEESSTKRVAPRKELERTVGGSNSVRSIATPPPQSFQAGGFAEYGTGLKHTDVIFISAPGGRVRVGPGLLRYCGCIPQCFAVLCGRDGPSGGIWIHRFRRVGVRGLKL